MASKKGKRYTAAEKVEVLNWVRQGGAAMSSGSGVRIAPNHSGVLRQLADLLDQISERESELNKLRKEYDALRKKL